MLLFTWEEAIVRHSGGHLQNHVIGRLKQEYSCPEPEFETSLGNTIRLHLEKERVGKGGERRKKREAKERTGGEWRSRQKRREKKAKETLF